MFICKLTNFGIVKPQRVGKTIRIRLRQFWQFGAIIELTKAVYKKRNSGLKKILGIKKILDF
jgi:hypothetical protein